MTGEDYFVGLISQLFFSYQFTALSTLGRVAGNTSSDSLPPPTKSGPKLISSIPDMILTADRNSVIINGRLVVCLGKF